MSEPNEEPFQMPAADAEALARGVEKKSASLREADLDKFVRRFDEFEAKQKKIPGMFKRLVNRTRLLFELVKDYQAGRYREVPWKTISMSIVAVLYFLNPFDFIPDFIPGLGQIDDALVLGFVFSSIAEDLKRYCDFRKLDPREFF